MGYAHNTIGLRQLEGILQPTTGLAKFEVEYDCIVLKPFKGEVCDAIVTHVSKVCILMLVVCASHSISPKMEDP